MDNTEQYYKQKIAEEIKQILSLEKNNTAAKNFWQTLEKITPKTCIVKSGMGAGEGIDFLLTFEKGGNKNPFNLFIDNIPEPILRFGFIFGLCPDIFHFNPKFSISNETHDFVNFKLVKNGK